MDDKRIDISNVPDENMKPVYLVLGIYEIHNYFAENEDKILDYIIMNEKILDIIDDINFIYTWDGLEPTVTKKRVGFLLNLTVIFDPEMEDNIIIFSNEDESENVKVQVNF